MRHDIPCITIDFNDDGGVDLQQDVGGNHQRISLHQTQVRFIAEKVGHLLPKPPADELAKRLARQLCEIRMELADECHRSHWLEMTYTKLDAFCNSIPDAAFPFDMFDGSDEQQTTAPETVAHPATVAAKATVAESATAAAPSFQLTAPA